MSSFKKGQKLTIRGEKLIISSLNDDGTVTLNYAAGSGKTGFAGKIVNPDSIKAATSPKAVFVESISPIEDSDSITLDQYNAGIDYSEKRVPSLNESFALQNSLSDSGVSDGEAIRALEAGIDKEKIIQAVTRPVGETIQEPTKEQVILRLEFLAAEKEFEDKYNNIINHKFRILTSPGDKRRFYHDSLKSLKESYSKVNLAGMFVNRAEQTEEWSVSKSRYRNSYQHENDGPKELNIPENNRRNEIYEAYSTIEADLKSKINKLDASWL
jgi:hypothetical protein